MQQYRPNNIPILNAPDSEKQQEEQILRQQDEENKDNEIVINGRSIPEDNNSNELDKESKRQSNLYNVIRKFGLMYNDIRNISDKKKKLKEIEYIFQ